MVAAPLFYTSTTNRTTEPLGRQQSPCARPQTTARINTTADTFSPKGYMRLLHPANGMRYHITVKHGSWTHKYPTANLKQRR